MPPVRWAESSSPDRPHGIVRGHRLLGKHVGRDLEPAAPGLPHHLREIHHRRPAHQQEGGTRLHQGELARTEESLVVAGDAGEHEHHLRRRQHFV